MDSFQSIDSGKGILKNDQQDSLGAALKSKRKKLAETKRLGDTPDNEEDELIKNQVDSL